MAAQKAGLKETLSFLDNCRLSYLWFTYVAADKVLSLAVLNEIFYVDYLSLMLNGVHLNSCCVHCSLM